MTPSPTKIRFIVQHSVSICLGFHAVAWFSVAFAWVINWWKNGPAPSGPAYNLPREFLADIDFLFYHSAHEWSVQIATRAATWDLGDLGAWFTVTFGALICALGSLQWFLLGKLVQSVDHRCGEKWCRVLLVGYGLVLLVAILRWMG